MNKFNQKIELAANILIVIFALLIIGVLVQRYFISSPAAKNSSQRIQPTIGKKVSLPDTNFSEKSKTLILALQSNCRFCTESAPFYKRLVEEAKDKNIKFVAVFPAEVEDSIRYLNELAINGFEVKQAPISVLDASGTPTLILTNDKGEVTNFWVGKLPADMEMEVINQLNFK